jgi:SPP1 family predicted phage head-tail adaptor
MKAGKLRHLIEFQEESTTQGDYGSQKGAWVTTATAYASIEPVGGKETATLPTFYAEATHKIVTRYQPGITPKLRVKYGDRLFDIKQVLNVGERNVELNIACTEAV